MIKMKMTWEGLSSQPYGMPFIVVAMQNKGNYACPTRCQQNIMAVCEHPPLGISYNTVVETFGHES